MRRQHIVSVTTTTIPIEKIYNDIYWRTTNIGCPAGVGGEAEEPGVWGHGFLPPPPKIITGSWNTDQGAMSAPTSDHTAWLHQIAQHARYIIIPYHHLPFPFTFTIRFKNQNYLSSTVYWIPPRSSPCSNPCLLPFLFPPRMWVAWEGNFNVCMAQSSESFVG